jgi:DNA-nicking Smr family endonuclease
MSRRPPHRGLSKDDERLWSEVKKSAKPLRPAPRERPRTEDAPASSPEPKPKPKPEPKAKSKPVAQPPPVYRPPVSQPRAAPPSPTLLDRRTVTRLTRGVIPVDARIDLHGLTQSAAHRRLLHFLDEAQAGGARVVLVITGKGRPGDQQGYGAVERGVLRRAVPEWLQSAAFLPIVTGFSEAGRRHGGAGAIYVRIRRRKD